MRPALRQILLSAPFDPRSIPGLQLWLDASRISGLADGDAVGSWLDLSGRGNNATQATAGNKPLYKTGIVNGRPVVRTDGVDDFFSLTSSVSLTGDFTLWWVVKLANVSSAYFGNSSPGANYLRQELTTSIGLVNSAAGSASITHTAVGTTLFRIVLLVRSGSGWTRYVNGAADGTATLSGTFAFNQLFIRGGPFNPASLDAAEIGIYDSALAADSRARLEGYLNAKYALF